MFNKKKKYFKSLVDANQRTIWGLEFKRFKALEIREEIRQSYDVSKAKLEVLNNQINQQKENPTLEEGEIKRLDDRKVLLEKDIKGYEEQIKGLDIEINGSKPTAELQNGYLGISGQIDAYRELLEMLKKFIKSI